MTTAHGAARNGRHSRDDVAKAALRILDEYGLPDLTMRRLAAELDVQPSALYWHFENKQTLLAELADRIASRGRTVAPPSADWMTVTAAEAASLRDALLAYRDGAEVVSSTLALGLGESVPLARLTSAVALGGFDDETSRRASTALLHFILGHVSHEQQRLQYDSIAVAAAGGSGGGGVSGAAGIARGGVAAGSVLPAVGGGSGLAAVAVGGAAPAAPAGGGVALGGTAPAGGALPVGGAAPAGGGVAVGGAAPGGGALPAGGGAPAGGALPASGGVGGTLEASERSATEGASEFTFGVQLFIAGLRALAPVASLTV